MGRPDPDTPCSRRGGPEPSSGLVFVNLSHPADIHDRQTQTQIRRHVMRDIGKARRRRPRPSNAPLEIVGNGEQEATAGTSAKWDVARYAPLTPARVPRGYYPVEPDSRALQLVHFVQAEGDYIHCPFRGVWIRVSLSDPGTFNLFLAYAVVFIKRWPRLTDLKLDEDAESGQYYSRALSRLQQQLGDRAERVSEGAVATVLGLLCQGYWAVSKTDWDRWSIHMDGLEQMWKVRGGFAGMGTDLQLLAFWMDVVGSTMFNRPPRFPPPPGLPGAREPPPETASPALRQLCGGLLRALPQLGPTVRALRLMAGVADQVNRRPHRHGYWRTDIDMVKMVAPVAHYILSVAPAPAGAPEQVAAAGAGAVPAASVVAEAVRLACLLLLGGLKARFGMPASELQPLRERFGALLGAESARWTSDLLDLHLWALVTAALQSQGAERQLLAGEIREVARTRRLVDAGDAVWKARNMLWIDAVETQPATLLLDELSTISTSF